MSLLHQSCCMEKEKCALLWKLIVVFQKFQFTAALSHFFLSCTILTNFASETCLNLKKTINI